MPGGVAGAPPTMGAPYADQGLPLRFVWLGWPGGKQANMPSLNRSFAEGLAEGPWYYKTCERISHGQGIGVTSPDDRVVIRFAGHLSSNFTFDPTQPVVVR